jgi:hypothetical protein
LYTPDFNSNCRRSEGGGGGVKILQEIEVKERKVKTQGKREKME